MVPVKSISPLGSLAARLVSHYQLETMMNLHAALTPKHVVFIGFNELACDYMYGDISFVESLASILTTNKRCLNIENHELPNSARRARR